MPDYFISGVRGLREVEEGRRSGLVNLLIVFIRKELFNLRRFLASLIFTPFWYSLLLLLLS